MVAFFEPKLNSGTEPYTTSAGATETVNKLILYVSAPPTAEDRAAERLVKDLDPTLRVIEDRDGDIFTPRLDAVLYDLSVYSGVDVIRSFVEQQQRRRG